MSTSSGTCREGRCVCGIQMVSQLPLYSHQLQHGCVMCADNLESTNDRVKLFSIMIMVGIVALGAWQVSRLTRVWWSACATELTFSSYICGRSSSGSILSTRHSISPAMHEPVEARRGLMMRHRRSQMLKLLDQLRLTSLSIFRRHSVFIWWTEKSRPVH